MAIRSPSSLNEKSERLENATGPISHSDPGGRHHESLARYAIRGRSAAGAAAGRTLPHLLSRAEHDVVYHGSGGAAPRLGDCGAWVNGPIPAIYLDSSVD